MTAADRIVDDRAEGSTGTDLEVRPVAPIAARETVELEVPNLYAALPSLLEQVPPGRVTTYGRLADALGNRSAARWVGEYLLDHPHDEGCRCHRVVRSTGEPGRYIAGDEQDKIRRLKQESIRVEDRRVDLSRFACDGFDCDRPLQRLTILQQRISESVLLTPFSGTPDVVAGVDVSYPASGTARGAYVLVETGSGRLVWSTTIERPATFPYIPGFLAFRELPLLLELFRAACESGRRADLAFVDGNGILHPRRAGIATCFGVLSGTPTIGIGKKLLLGSVDLKCATPDEPQPVLSDGQVLGMALKAKSTSRPIYVSPGHLLDVADAVRMTRLLFHGHRLPEPIYHADAVSRRP